MSYYKHTNGEAFTLNGNDYSGFFNISASIPFSGKVYDLDSVKLEVKNNFITDFYTTGKELDTIYKNVDQVVPYYSNVFDILNKQGLDNALGLIDDNNLICFKSLVIGHPTIYQFEKNSGRFYGLSTINVEDPQVRCFNLDIVPFKNDETWGFMDSVRTGSFVINSREDFKYLCSTGTDVYILSGSFTSNTPLAILSRINLHPDFTYDPDYNYHIHNDPDNSRIIFVNNDFINIYDSSNYDECNKLILIDRIALNKTTTDEFVWDRTRIKWGNMKFKWNTRFNTNNSNNPEFIKFGNNFRTSIDGSILKIYNKYSTDLYKSLNLASYGVSNIISIDIRSTDDNVLILYKLLDDLYILELDILTNQYKTTKLNSINPTLEKYTVKFSEIDSNVFFISNQYEYQSRFLSRADYPSGRFETNNLFYGDRLKWNTTHQQWDDIRFKWDSAKLPSNNYNNLIASQLYRNNKMYMLLHNIGRLYVVAQPVNDRFFNNVPLNLSKFYDGSICSESSLGLYFNTSISNIVKDTLNLFNQSAGNFSIEEKQVLVNQIDDLILNVKNFYLNGNETFNVISIQRIFLNINETQKRLLSISV